MSHFGPPDSIRRRVGGPLSEGGPGPRLSGRSVLKSAFLAGGSTNALGGTEQKIAISRPRPEDPLMTSHFGHPTAFDDAWGGPLLEGGPGPRFSAAAQPRESPNHRTL